MAEGGSSNLPSSKFAFALFLLPGTAVLGSSGQYRRIAACPKDLELTLQHIPCNYRDVTEVPIAPLHGAPNKCAPDQKLRQWLLEGSLAWKMENEGSCHALHPACCSYVWALTTGIHC
ncbi:putative methyltransferase C70.08c [Fusarium oxysporum f. sp. albedinis]|nr:putative methyltransferase C70.08c [Fusarium oxysporum f. sp. albedinis]